jgi:PAS domain S-box-containing protein
MNDQSRVLYFNCDPDLGDAVAESLQRKEERLSVDTVVDPDEALEKIDGGEFDCVVSAHDVPRQDGIAFLESVREPHPDLPFILFTENGSEAVASEAISAGVTDYVRKNGGDAAYADLADRIVGVVDRHRSHHTPRNTGRELSQIVAATDDVLFLFDADWSELLFVNSAYEDVYGGSIVDLERDPRSFLELIHPEDRENVIQSMERLSAGDPDTLEYRIVRPDGERRWVHADGKPILDDEDEVVRIGGFVRDITERKQYERELERQNERLDEFAGAVSHELRNPLNVAWGQLDIARKKHESDHLEEVARAHDRMKRLIEDIVKLARTGEQVTDVQPVSLEDMAIECWDIVETTNARLHVRTDQTIRADASRLTQLFENLFRNAVEHGSTTESSDTSGGDSEQVTVTVGDLDDAAGFYVEDDGPGVPSERRDRVFEAGYTTTTDRTGFGLSIVSEIVEAHGWEIRITDGTDGDARFEILGVGTGA